MMHAISRFLGWLWSGCGSSKGGSPRGRRRMPLAIMFSLRPERRDENQNLAIPASCATCI